MLMDKKRKKPPRIPRKELRFPTRAPSLSQSSPHTLRWLLIGFILISLCGLFVLGFWALLVRAGIPVTDVAPNWLHPWLPKPPVVVEVLPVETATTTTGFDIVPNCPPPIPATLEEHLACIEIVDLEPRFAEIEALF